MVYLDFYWRTALFCTLFVSLSSPPISRQANSCDLIPECTVLVVVVILQLVLLKFILHFHLKLLLLLESDSGCGRSSI
jgi:hypothetical protein